MKPQRVAVLGSTGSIGRATLDVIRRFPGRFQVSALACRASVPTIVRQAREFAEDRVPGRFAEDCAPRRFAVPRVVLFEPEACARAQRRLGPGFRVETGPDPLLEIAADADILLMAMTGTAGLYPVLAALERGRRVALATKEILVGFGEPVMRLAARHNAEIIPVDSELSAIHQCLRAGRHPEISRVILTASGGPFRAVRPGRNITAEAVLRHPTWRMGPKITVDSATLMNKGLELIETVRLFGLAPDRVEAVIHPGSLVHSLVEFKDGSLLAQLARPDMRLPIQYALTWPERLPSPVRNLTVHEFRRLEFTPVPVRRFPCYALARTALETGPAATCVLNAANELAVEAFLAGRLPYRRIPVVVAESLARLAPSPRSAGRKAVSGQNSKAKSQKPKPTERTKTERKNAAKRTARSPGIPDLIRLERQARQLTARLLAAKHTGGK